MPFRVDGLIVAGSVVLLQSVPGQRWLGWIGVGPGVVISLFANADIRHPVRVAVGYLGGIPAVSFSLATFMLERWLAGQALQFEPSRQPVLIQVALDAEQAAQNALRATTRRAAALGPAAR